MFHALFFNDMIYTVVQAVFCLVRYLFIDLTCTVLQAVLCDVIECDVRFHLSSIFTVSYGDG